MTRYFLVEADTDYESLFCYEVERQGYDNTGRSLFVKKASTALFNKSDRPQFFGNLSSLCVTKNSFKDVPPLALAKPDIADAEDLDQQDAPQHVADALAETVQELVERTQGEAR
jgi:hypothetical protein